MHAVQLTINHHRAEMSDLHIKLINEQQKNDRQTTINEQQGNQMRDLQKELKVRLLERSFFYKNDFLKTPVSVSNCIDN